MNSLYRLEKKDIDKGAEMLAKAFYDYPMFQHVLREKHNDESLKTVLRFLMKYAVLYGEAYASSPNMEGIILFSDFEDYNFSLFRSLRSGALSLSKLGKDAANRFSEFDSFSLTRHKACIQDPHLYIILIGVDPKKQGQGFGRKLMHPVLKAAEEKGQACYLETHGEENAAIYKTFGFDVVSQDLVPGTDILQYAMLKNKVV